MSLRKWDLGPTRPPRCCRSRTNVQWRTAVLPRTIWTAAGEVELSPSELAERTLHRRAVEGVIWRMPAVNYHLMYQALVRDANGPFNQIAYWSRLPDWKIQTLTPNPDAIYFAPFINTRDAGPMVLEIPAADEGSITGTVMDVWQCALEDVGPAGG
jgi:hypothetical protein